MVESVSASEAYQEFEKRNNRFLNMLADNVSLSKFSFALFPTTIALQDIDILCLGQKPPQTRPRGHPQVPHRRERQQNR